MRYNLLLTKIKQDDYFPTVDLLINYIFRWGRNQDGGRFLLKGREELPTNIFESIKENIKWQRYQNPFLKEYKMTTISKSYF